MSNLSVFSFLEDTSSLNKLLSELSKELGDSSEGFLVNVSGELSKSSDDGSEESFVSRLLVESFLYGFIFGFDLCE